MTARISPMMTYVFAPGWACSSSCSPASCSRWCSVVLIVSPVDLLIRNQIHERERADRRVGHVEGLTRQRAVEAAVLVHEIGGDQRAEEHAVRGQEGPHQQLAVVLPGTGVRVLEDERRLDRGRRRGARLHHDWNGGVGHLYGSSNDQP